jgi:multidrug resistance efflux pump
MKRFINYLIKVILLTTSLILTFIIYYWLMIFSWMIITRNFEIHKPYYIIVFISIILTILTFGFYEPANRNNS